jgi:hypothetical protein
VRHSSVKLLPVSGSNDALRVFLLELFLLVCTRVGIAQLLLFEMIVAPFGTANSRWERCRKHPLLPPMPPDDLLSALLDDIAWPAATLRLEFNHLDLL